MIYVPRSKSAPVVFSSRPVTSLRNDLHKFYEERSAQSRLQEKPYYETLPDQVLLKILMALSKEFHGKCAYCETPVKVESGWGSFDHFRPKASAKGTKEIAKQHYWWLAYTWENMYLSCPNCNKYKSSWFPVKGKRGHLNLPHRKLIEAEDNLILDPCYDRPDEHFVFNPDGTITPFTEYGDTTVELLQLNRKDLIRSRKLASKEFIETAEHFEKLWKANDWNEDESFKIAESLCHQLVDVFLNYQKLPYGGAILNIVERWLNSDLNRADFILKNKKPRHYNKGFARALHQYRKQILLARKGIPVRKQETGTRSKSSKQTLKRKKEISPHIFLDRIEIKNFKVICDLSIRFPKSGTKQEGWLMLLGENGVGKSTFLQAMALTLMGQSYLSKMKLRPSDILRHGEKSGYVKIFVQDKDEPISIQFDETSKKIKSSLRLPVSYLLGYGSTRLFPTKILRPETTRGRVKVKNLFEAGVSLADAKKWLLNADTKKFSQASIALKDLLLLGKSSVLVREENRVVVQYKNNEYDDLNELSDGYKSIIAVTVDIMKTFMPDQHKTIIHSTMEDAEGIVLLDEIGTHLHPLWRMQVVESFRRTFPRLQFIVTTHDPLCLRGLGLGEVAVFQKDENREIHVITDLPDPSEFRVEQILKSEFFGLNSTSEPKIEALFNEYYYLLSKQTLTNKEQARLNNLKDELREKRHLGQSRREEIVFSIVDRVLAKNKSTSVEQILQNSTLMEETVDKVREAWASSIGEN